MIFSAEINFTLIHTVYVGVFGAVMVVLDFPRADPRANAARRTMTKYLRFLTLFSGRGLAYIFLATMTYSALHDNKVGGVVGSFFGYIFGGYIFLVGCFCVYWGYKESKKLHAFRLKLIEKVSGAPNFLSQYMTNRGGQNGMTVEQFIELAKSMQTTFDEETVGFIFDSLRGSLAPGAQFLALEDFQVWTAPPAEGERLGYTVF